MKRKALIRHLLDEGCKFHREGARHTGKFHGAEANEPSFNAVKSDPNSVSIRNLSAREKYSGYQVGFIESVALPSGLIEEIAYDGGESNYFKTFS